MKTKRSMNLKIWQLSLMGYDQEALVTMDMDMGTDTAPVGLLSDAYVLSSYCDATLYVVRHNHTRKVSIQRLDENKKINELKNMAIVFNGIRSRGFGNNGYGYGYGYGTGRSSLRCLCAFLLL